MPTPSRVPAANDHSVWIVDDRTPNTPESFVAMHTNVSSGATDAFRNTKNRCFATYGLAMY